MLRFYTVNFYHNDQIGLFEKDMPAEGYLLVGRRDFEGFKPKYESEYTFEEVYQSLKAELYEKLSHNATLPIQQLLDNRYNRFRRLGAGNG